MKLNATKRKRFRVSNKVKKVSPNDRFRLSISRSSKNISAQIIDDLKNITLLSASSIEKDIKSGTKTNKTELSKIVAEKLAKKAQEKKIKKIYFDIPEGIKIAVEKQTTLKITGSDKQLVGEVASKIKTLRKIEPYKGKGVREKGQYVLKKEGKKK